MSQTNQETTIRTARLDDAGAVADIYNHYVKVGGATFDTSMWAVAQVIEIMDVPPPQCWLVAESPSQMVGWASARQFSNRFGYRFSVETAIYLAPESMGGGLADRLQNELIQKCRQAGLHHAMARVIAGNERSMRFHQRHGYELVGIQKEIGHIAGDWADVAILQKIL